ncbi:cyclic nucleotide-binding domain-containing protein [Natronosporangium hydrolyticum]|uniref:histidine kinase n=1 Tax=Natronosporangium hydrolyticum TaxID=2811111 RepID=A0A895YBB3_9ACTN|nr:ATP-binding protein [Natronosporangium hydrolyticum]QSB14711.1 cyclic nucleotide-binding domain-containing protein [Natronosporangium hydrolyticum]
MTGPNIAIDELRSLFLFEALTDDQLGWIAERAQVRTFDAGAVVYRADEPAEALWVLLDGRLRLTRTADGEEVPVNETAHRGAYAGAIRAFTAAAPGIYQSSMVTVAPSRFLRISADDFSTLMHDWFPLAVHLLDGLYLGIQNTEATIRQREHLAQLGHLAANLAHELNNPAAAAVRASAQLRTRVAGMRHKLGLLAGQRIDPELLRTLVTVQEAAVERAAKPREPLSSLAESDLEDALADQLSDLGIPDAYALAPVFAGAGLDADWLAEVADGLAPDAREGALRWLAYTVETELLMDEIEDASTRVSTLVAAVRQYSHLDQAAHQEIDLHPGLDSTLVMLGHKLTAVQVHREYDRELPTVPAYASELNQVWTNLIDNAVDAMAGRGDLWIRTYRDGEWAAVAITDTGPGIPDSVRGNLFDAYVTTKPVGQGSGLGLDNARRIVTRRHRGELSFTTGPDGTTFTTRLPLPPGVEAAATEQGRQT